MSSQRFCRKCGVELVLGNNWYPSSARYRNYICQRCAKAENRKYHKRKAAYDKRYAKENQVLIREKKKKRRAENQAEYQDKKRGYQLQYHYKITVEEYDGMLEAQGGGCAICGKTPEENGRRLDVDHDHETGEVRGLLCNICNKALGAFGDSLGLLVAAVAYMSDGETHL